MVSSARTRGLASLDPWPSVREPAKWARPARQRRSSVTAAHLDPYVSLGGCRRVNLPLLLHKKLQEGQRQQATICCRFCMGIDIGFGCQDPVRSHARALRSTFSEQPWACKIRHPARQIQRCRLDTQALQHHPPRPPWLRAASTQQLLPCGEGWRAWLDYSVSPVISA